MSSQWHQIRGKQNQIASHHLIHSCEYTPLYVENGLWKMKLNELEKLKLDRQSSFVLLLGKSIGIYILTWPGLIKRWNFGSAEISADTWAALGSQQNGPLKSTLSPPGEQYTAELVDSGKWCGYSWSLLLIGCLSNRGKNFSMRIFSNTVIVIGARLREG